MVVSGPATEQEDRPKSIPGRRVLIIQNSSDLYGSDLACLRVAKGAAQAGWEVEVLLPGPGPLQELLAEGHITTCQMEDLVLRRADLRGLRALSAPIRWMRQLVGLRRFGTQHHFDLVHTNAAVDLGGMVLARRWKAGHIWHVHEIFGRSRVLLRALERLLETADVVVCCSQAVKEQFKGSRLRDRCRVIYTGAEVPEGIARTTPLVGETATVTCVARLNEWKGQDVLLDALAQLVPDFPGLRLRIIGDVFRSEYQFRKRLEQQAADLGLRTVVAFDGERRDALEIVAQSDIFVLPSRRAEPFGMALVEAMWLGRPVVATRAGGPAEIVSDGVDGLLVPPGEPKPLAEAMRSLLLNPVWARSLGTQAAVRARQFDSTSMVDDVLLAYEDTVQRAAGGV